MNETEEDGRPLVLGKVNGLSNPWPLAIRPSALTPRQSSVGFEPPDGRFVLCVIRTD